MSYIKTPEEIAVLREGGKRLAKILQEMMGAVKAGVSAFELNKLAEGLIFQSGGEPSFKGYKSKKSEKPYLYATCISINDEVVHAVPRADKILKDGDVVGLDIGMLWPSGALTYPSEAKAEGVGGAKEAGGRRRGMYTDMAVTLGIGKVSPDAERLIRTTKEALDIGIRAVRPGVKIGDVGYLIQRHLEKNNLGVIRDLAGHGVGHAVHEEPLIPNYGKKGAGSELMEGMVIAIEPMATLGDWRVVLDKDGFAFRTADGSLGAHFEHTLAVTKTGAEVLTKI